MPVVNAACPYCGEATLVTAPEDGALEGVVKDVNDVPRGWTGTDAACSECGSQFYGMFSK